MLRQHVNMGEGDIPSGLLPFICSCPFISTFFLQVILVDGFANPSEGGLERSSDKPSVFSCYSDTLAICPNGSWKKSDGSSPLKAE